MTLELPAHFYEVGLQVLPIDVNVFQYESELVILMEELIKKMKEVIDALESKIARNPHLDHTEEIRKIRTYYNQVIKNLFEEQQ